jgi:hypothetical protein
MCYTFYHAKAIAHTHTDTFGTLNGLLHRMAIFIQQKDGIRASQTSRNTAATRDHLLSIDYSDFSRR